MLYDRISFIRNSTKTMVVLTLWDSWIEPSIPPLLQGVPHESPLGRFQFLYPTCDLSPIELSEPLFSKFVCMECEPEKEQEKDSDYTRNDSTISRDQHVSAYPSAGPPDLAPNCSGTFQAYWPVLRFLPNRGTSIDRSLPYHAARLPSYRATENPDVQPVPSLFATNVLIH